MTTNAALRLGLAGLILVAVGLTASLTVYVATRDDSSPQAISGDFVVLKVGPWKADRSPGEVVYLVQSRDDIASTVPELADKIDANFDFTRRSLVVWIRSTAPPFGAARPVPRAALVRESQEPELRVEWSTSCGPDTAGPVYAIIAVLPDTFLHPGWSVRHSVPAAEPSVAGRVPFREGPRNTFGRRHDVDVAVISSVDALDRFLAEESGPGVAALRTAEVDFSRETLIGVFATEYERRTIELIQATGAEGKVVTSLVRVGGVVPAAAVAWFDFVVVEKAAVAGITRWELVDDGEARLTGAC